ncbi:uncharacterized protein LOC126236550 [Schistocerca nitens]|uniref:uncharacterized protein LOC126236550 n=1 Tax=Schistocerca nitens TaxID=7011 RepID=UPI002117E4F5|nr:uncharacterized protein LOC126236550 [Schistocerca nitens]
MARGSATAALRHAVLAARTTCAKVLKKLGPRGARRPRHHVAMAASDNPVFSCGEPAVCSAEPQRPPADVQPEDAKSRLTVLTWLDDVADLEDMDNRLNEALEAKMAAAQRGGCTSG